MPVIKYIGIFLLSSSISCYGAILSSRLREAFVLRQEVLSLLKNIERGINHGRIPVFMVLRDFPEGELKRSGLCQRISNQSNTDSAVEECLAKLCNEDKKMLKAYFSQLGKSPSCECERQNIRYIIDYFEKTQSESERDISSKASLYKKISIISALLAAIIFI